jgi:hypothetical protein
MKIKQNNLKKIILLVATLTLVLLLASCSNDVTKPDASSDIASTPIEKTVTRSFDEWLAAQGTYCWPDDEGGCFIFNDPVPNYTAWYDPDSWYAIWPDYAGLAAAWLYAESGGAIDIGTNITGKVTERTRADGTALIHINLRATEALIFGLNWDTWESLFGYWPQEVAYEGKEPVLGNVSMNLKFVMPEPGMPLPDLIEVSFFPEENMYVEFMSVKCKAEGDLREATGYPEGTWGRARITQVNTAIPMPHNNDNWDAWPVENVYIGP